MKTENRTKYQIQAQDGALVATGTKDELLKFAAQKDWAWQKKLNSSIFGGYWLDKNGIKYIPV